jgi:hypothetical protein
VVKDPLDLGHNYVLADARCNGEKADRLAAFDHLSRWCARNARPDWTDALERRRTRTSGAWARTIGPNLSKWRWTLRGHEDGAQSDGLTSA